MVKHILIIRQVEQNTDTLIFNWNCFIVSMEQQTFQYYRKTHINNDIFVALANDFCVWYFKYFARP